MTKKKNLIITILLAIFFIATFFMPALKGPLGMDLNGATVFGVQFSTILFVDSVTEYAWFLFNSLTNLWVVLLLLWSLRGKVKMIPTFILVLLAGMSCWSWLASMESGVLLYGYWLWSISIIMISAFAIYRTRTPRIS